MGAWVGRVWIWMGVKIHHQERNRNPGNRARASGAELNALVARPLVPTVARTQVPSLEMHVCVCVCVCVSALKREWVFTA